MPTYTRPARPPRAFRHGPQPLNFDWVVRSTNAQATIRSMLSAVTDPVAIEHLDKALAHLALLRNVETNKTYKDTFALAARHLALATHLVQER